MARWHGTATDFLRFRKLVAANTDLNVFDDPHGETPLILTDVAGGGQIEFQFDPGDTAS